MFPNIKCIFKQTSIMYEFTETMQIITNILIYLDYKGSESIENGILSHKLVDYPYYYKNNFETKAAKELIRIPLAILLWFLFNINKIMGYSIGGGRLFFPDAWLA